MKPAVIFDLDGTLIDTPRGIVESFSAALTSMNRAAIDSKVIRATIGLPLDQAFANLLGVDKSDSQVLFGIKQYQTFFKEIVLPKAQELIFPNVTQVLSLLKAQGFILAVATSKFYASAEALLKAAGLWEYFHLVVGADQVTHPKPHPEMGELIMKQLGIFAQKTVMVGDTTHDIFMAKGANMCSIAVTYGIHDIEKLKSAEPTWIVNSFDEILTHTLTMREFSQNGEI